MKKNKELIIKLQSFVINLDAERGIISKISNENQSIEFKRLAWEIELADKSVITLDTSLEFSYKCTDKLSMLWQGSGVAVEMTFFVADNLLKSNISVKSDDIAINRVYYPIYEGVKKLSDDELLLPWQNGLSIKDPLKNLVAPNKKPEFWMGRGGGYYENDYPAQYSYQLFAYYQASGKGYYMSTDDGEAYIKSMGIYPGAEEQRIDFRFINYPENMGITRSYNQPYNYVFAFLSNGWREAVKLYKEWAKGQKWYLPIKERKLSKELEKIDFVRINHEHYRVGTDDKEYFETTKLIKERLDCNPLVHWYGWNKAPKHGDWYPEMADWSSSEWHSGLLQRNEELDKIGVKKIPYVNVHLWDKKLKSFNEECAADTLVVAESKRIEDEPWTADKSLYAVCHATEKMQKKAVDLFRHIVEEDGFDGIYIDQVASFNATLCFGENHGHPIGGGNWWANEYDKMIGGFRANMPKDKILTTESCCECYHNLFDMFLILDTSIKASGFPGLCGINNVNVLPLFKLIYGESAIAYGTSCQFENGDGQFEFNYIRSILYGMIPTVEGVETQHENDEFKWSVLKRGVDFFKKNREVLLCGELSDYIAFNNERTILVDGVEMLCPEVVAVVYNYNGKQYIFAYNYTDDDKFISVERKNINVKAKSFAEI